MWGGQEQLEILFLGRITAEKGIDYILSACEKLKNNGINFKLHIAGKEQGIDNYIEQFTAALGSLFCYEGVVYGKTKAELLKRCNVFLLPSFYEGLPMSLLEAMSYGEVPIVTDVGSINTVIDDKINGLFVQVKDSRSIVEAVTTLLENSDYKRRLSENARLTIFEKFNPDIYLRHLNEIYKMMMKD